MNSFYNDNFIIEYDDIISSTNQTSNLAFLKFFQEIAGRHASTLGYGLNDIQNTHLTWLVLSWKFQIFKRPIYGDKIRIKTWPRKAVKSIYYRDFEIYNDKNELIGIASSKWVLVNTKTHEMVLDNSEIIKKFVPQNQSVFDEEIKKITVPEKFSNTFTYKILRRDIDTNNHVNNAIYLSIAVEALPEEVFNDIMNYNSVEIMYKTECTINDTVIVKYSQIDESSFVVVIANANTNSVHCVIRYKK